jgi:hypothetical protein
VRHPKEKQMKYPKSLFIYISDHVEDEPVYCVAISVDEIPEETAEEKIGIYTLQSTKIMRIKRELL